MYSSFCLSLCRLHVCVGQPLISDRGDLDRQSDVSNPLHGGCLPWVLFMGSALAAIETRCMVVATWSFDLGLVLDLYFF